MIYFIDEDIQYANEFTVPLRLRNFEVSVIPDADLAFDKLELAQDVSLAVVDIMLATGDGAKSRFSRADTRDFIKTGLLLISYLNSKRKDVFPERFVVLTAASDRSLIQEIFEACDPLGIEVLRKGDYSSPRSLADKLQTLVK